MTFSFIIHAKSSLSLFLFSIQFLEQIATQSGCNFQYFYPCEGYAAGSVCPDIEAKNITKALAMMTNDFCTVQVVNATAGIGLCFAAGAIKLTESM